jgi:phosphatidylglycerophosphate synthase
VGGAAVAIGLATWAVLAGRPRVAGVLALLAGVLLTVSGALVRRRQGLSRLLDAFVDRAFDGCVLGAVAWVARTHDRSAAAASLIALGASFLSSYVRARGASLGYDVEEGVGARAIRCALAGLALALGGSAWTLWTLAGFMALVATVRSSQVPKEERLAAEP